MDKLFNLQPKRVAIFRALQIGDLLCSIPAIRAFKKAFPNTEITLLGLPWAENFVKRFSDYFSGFIHFPGYPGIIEQPFKVEAFISFLSKMNKEKFDLILQLHGNGSIINPMIQMLGSRNTAGYHEYGRYCPDPEVFMPYPEGLHEIERHLKLMEFMGVPSAGTNMEFPIALEEYISFYSLLEKYHLQPKKYVCVHSGARDTKRWWEPENFAKAADIIAEKGYTIVLTGTEIEKATAERVEDLMKYPALNLVGKTDLGTLAALIKNAKMLLSNDTGVSHIASALETPSVIIFLASDPDRWAPLNRDLHHIILPQEADDLEFVLQHIDYVLRYEEAEVKA